MKLRVRALGMTAGIMTGVGFFSMIVLSLWFGSGQAIGVLSIFLPYFGRNAAGAVYGLVGGFIEGFLAGALFAWLYNKLHAMFYKSEAAT